MSGVLRRSRSRDPRQARVLTPSALRWVVRNRAWTPYYLVRYWRFLKLRVRHPEVVTEGFVFLGRDVDLHVRRGQGRIVLGRWVHLGDGTRLRAHEGTLRLGDKVVLGSSNTINCLLDIEIGAASLLADWIYICDFDHRTEDLDVPIKDQGVVKSPVRIGPDCWIGVKVTVLRGTTVGRGSVLAAHSVVRGTVPAESVVAGVPGRVVKNRRQARDERRRTTVGARSRTLRRTRRA
jgi:acetyltransferase-like isoleucine patch superfamily enzyme